MRLQLQVSVVVEAADPIGATAALDAVVAALGRPIERRWPVEAYPKVPGGWMAVIDPALDDGDPAEVVARVTERLATSGWMVTDQDGEADAVWNQDRDVVPPTFVHPAVRWSHVHAFPPIADQDLDEPVPLVPEGPVA